MNKACQPKWRAHKAPSISSARLFFQTLIPKLGALLFYLSFVLPGQIPVAVSDLIVPETGISVNQLIQQNIRRCRKLRAVPIVPFWLPGQQGIAVAGEQNLLERVLLKVISENLKHFFKRQHLLHS